VRRADGGAADMSVTCRSSIARNRGYHTEGCHGDPFFSPKSQRSSVRHGGASMLTCLHASLLPSEAVHALCRSV
jgi:hypothetical protein